jgi:translocation and assembly module TamA
VRRWIVGLGLVSAACAGARPPRPVESVKLVGNHSFKTRTIVDKLATRPPHGWLVKTREPFDPIALEVDRKRVEAFYRDHGFFAARVEDVNVDTRGDGTVHITIFVHEGEPTRIASVALRGPESDVAKPLLGKVVDFRVGKNVDYPEYVLARDKLRAELAHRGYAHATVEGQIQVDRATRQAVIDLDVDPGPLVQFGETTIVGLGRIPESAVRARLAYEKGDRFDPVKLERTEAALYRLGVFSVVRTDFAEEGRPAISDVTIRVSEGASHELRFGFGVGSDTTRTEVHARAGYTVRNFVWPLATLRLDATPGYTIVGVDGQRTGPTAEALAQLTKDDFVLPMLKGSALAAYTLEPRQGYTVTGPRLQLALDRPLIGHELVLHLAWEVQSLDFVDVAPGVFGPDATAQWVGYYTQGLILDLRNSGLEPKRGIFALATVDEGGAWAGSERDFVRVLAELRGYVPATERVTLAARVRVARLYTLDDGDSPLTLRIYGGGADDHRGFGFRRLAPERRDTNGNVIPVGGAEEFLASAETRIDVGKLGGRWLSLVAFLDAGDVTPAGMLDLGNLHYAAGLGVRYDTIVGPVRLDVAVRLNRVDEAGIDGLANPDPGQRFQAHFSLGEAF